ncbi:MAG: HNH endonuclease [Acutalibacteraceae bacterium]
MGSRMSAACDISQRVRREVYERDGGRCVYCGNPNRLQTAHYIPRSLGGLGVPMNLCMLCLDCHTALDNGADTALREDIRQAVKAHLQKQYPAWAEDRLRIGRWGFGSPD